MQLYYARDFGSTALELAKRMTQWSAFYFIHTTSYYPVPSTQIHLQDFPRMSEQSLPFMSSADQDLMRNWANTHGKCVRQRTVRQETTKYKAGTLPLNMYQTATHQGERLEFEEQPGLSEDEGREGASTSRDPGGDQQSEYDDDSSDSDSDDFVVEEDGAVHHTQNSELGFLFEAPRTRSGRIVKTSNKALLWM